MASTARAVVFDVDGVLLDSLPQHLQICRDKAAEYSLTSVRVPDVDEFRRMVQAGVKVSPMRSFFLAVGFSESQADRAVGDYEREFMVRYRPQPFPGVGRMLSQLREAGLTLGLVTSNTRANVAPALGPAMPCFDSRCLYYFDSFAIPRTKAWCLEDAARVLHLRPEECLYVGDQPADVEAAGHAGVPFVGVSYGWGLTHDAAGLELADDIAHLSRILARSTAT